MGDLPKAAGPRPVLKRGAIWAIGMMALLVIVTAFAWPYLCARAIETRLQAWVQDSDPQGEWVWRKLSHQRGWLRSSGSVELRVRSRCSSDAALRNGGVMVLRYEMLHWPTLSAASSFSWELRAASTAQGQVIRALLGTQASATGEGAIGWDQSLRSSVHLPALHANVAQFSWRSDPAHGMLQWTPSGLRANLQLGQLSASRDDWALHAHGLNLVVSTPPGPAGLGAVTLQARRMAGSNWQVNKFTLEAHTDEAQSRLRTHWRHRAAWAQWRDTALRDLQLDLALNELNAPSVRTLAGIFGQSCRLEHLGDDDARSWRHAMRTLLTRGLGIEVTRFAARRVAPSGDAELSGRWSIGLTPSPQADRVSLSEQLVSDGQLLVRGEGLPSLLRESALASGYFTATPEGLSGRYRYQQGRLFIGQQSQSASDVAPAWLGVVDRAIEALLNPHPSVSDSAPNSPAQPPPSGEPLVLPRSASGSGTGAASLSELGPAAASGASVPAP